MYASRRFSSGIVFFLISTVSFAQYTAVILENPPGHPWAVGAGAGLKNSGGYSVPPGSMGIGDYRALIWFKNQPLDVTPSNFFSARILNSRDGQHVGNVAASFYSPPLAYLWNSQGVGTLLHPADFTTSIAWGVGGGKQVGQITLSSMCFECGYYVERHAVMWSGTAESMVRLHGPGFDEVRAVDTDGTRVVGSGYLSQIGQYRAIVWLSPSSIVNMHPQGFRSTFAFGVDGNSQVGFGETDTGSHALLWHGSAASVVDLHPPGYELTVAYSVAGNVQVGAGRPINSYPDRALVWRGTRSSVIDLHQFLPVGFRIYNSTADDVDQNGVIVGTCSEDATGLTRAVMWVPNFGQKT